MISFSRRASLVLLLATAIGLGATTAVAEGAATASVRKANQTLSELLRKKAEPGSAEEKALTKEVTARLSTFLDVDELGRRALKDH